MFLSPTSDYDKLGKDLYEAGYNAVSVFLSTIWNHGLVPWKKSPTGKFNFGQIDPAYADNYRRMLKAMAFWRITVHNKFVDQFHDIKDFPGDDPMRQGLGKLYSDVVLYESLDKSDNDNWKNVWIGWKEIGAGKYEDYKMLSDFGRGMELFIDFIIGVNKEIYAEFPDYQGSWAWANECLGEYDPATGTQKNIRGDRDEIHQWIFKKWQASGIPSSKIRNYFDYFVRIKGEPRTPHYPAFVEEQMWIQQRYGALIEIHGILTNADIAKFKNATWTDKHGVKHKFIINRALFSTDGDMRMVADYEHLGEDSKGKTVCHVDRKLDYAPNDLPTAGEKVNFMKFWERYFVKGGYPHYVKGD